LGQYSVQLWAASLNGRSEHVNGLKELQDRSKQLEDTRKELESDLKLAAKEVAEHGFCRTWARPA
jgi:hypothetical protein